jgi:hypothetical protein
MSGHGRCDNGSPGYVRIENQDQITFFDQAVLPSESETSVTVMLVGDVDVSRTGLKDRKSEQLDEFDESIYGCKIPPEVARHDERSLGLDERFDYTNYHYERGGLGQSTRKCMEAEETISTRRRTYLICSTESVPLVSIFLLLVRLEYTRDRGVLQSPRAAPKRRLDLEARRLRIVELAKPPLAHSSLI